MLDGISLRATLTPQTIEVLLITLLSEGSSTRLLMPSISKSLSPITGGSKLLPVTSVSSRDDASIAIPLTLPPQGVCHWD